MSQQPALTWFSVSQQPALTWFSVSQQPALTWFSVSQQPALTWFSVSQQPALTWFSVSQQPALTWFSVSQQPALTWFSVSQQPALTWFSVSQQPALTWFSVSQQPALTWFSVSQQPALTWFSVSQRACSSRSLVRLNGKQRSLLSLRLRTRRRGMRPISSGIDVRLLLRSDSSVMPLQLPSCNHTLPVFQLGMFLRALHPARTVLRPARLSGALPKLFIKRKQKNYFSIFFSFLFFSYKM